VVQPLDLGAIEMQCLLNCSIPASRMTEANALGSKTPFDFLGCDPATRPRLAHLQLCFRLIRDDEATHDVSSDVKIPL
jgi:hypothetical protein